MPLSELIEWQTYWAVKAEAEKKAHEKARREAESKSRARPTRSRRR